MIDYSLELSLEKIYNHKTRDYFKDILASYYCGNFRGSLVMLYSVVVCDLLYKLIELKEISEVKEAIFILDEIQTLQKNNPKSSEWEKKLIELVNEKTDMLDTPDYVNIKNLESHRHLCAHPVFTSDYALYLPSDITTKSHIRNIYDGVLTKPPMRSKEIFLDILKDMALRKDIFPTDKELERYLLSKYFKYLRNDLIKRIFKDLWKFVFRLDNQDAQINRQINFRILRIVYNNYKDILRITIENEKSYFSEIDVNISIVYFIDLIIEYPYIYTIMEDRTKALVENKAKENFGLQLLLGTVSENLLTVINNAKELYRTNIMIVEPNTFFEILNKLLNIGIQKGYVQDAINVSIDFHVTSSNYNEADYTFSELVKPIIEYYKKDDFIKLLEGIEKNGQANGRRAAPRDYMLVHNQMILSNSNIDIRNYPYFKKSIS
jgi:hypothetical protein